MKLARKETELLDGRLTMRLPGKARLEPRQVSIMAAPESSQDETRVVIDAGEARMVVMVYEMYALGGATFDRNVRAMLGEGEGDYNVTQLELSHSGLFGIATIPTKHDLTSEAVLVMGLYLANVDNTVQFLGFYVNPTAAKDPGGALELAKNMATTIRPGRRRLEKDGGRVQLRELHDKILEIELPENYVASAQRGPDFSVHSIRKLVQLGAAAPTLGVYVGQHPSYHHVHERAEFDTVELALLGKTREWHRWKTQYGEQTTTMLEAMARLPGGEQAPLTHVFLSADDDTTLAELQRIANSLQVVERRE